MKTINVAVIGAGHLGQWHARKYDAIAHARLVGIADPNPSCAQLAAELNCRYTPDYRELLQDVDAVSVATPTIHHFEIAKTCIEHQCHVLIEKPITVCADQAQLLIDYAHQQQVVIQVGHIERYNPGFIAAKPYISHPELISCHRSAPFKSRGTDVSVVHDLMIHDIDIVLSLIQQPVQSIHAVGRQLLSQTLDYVQAELCFADQRRAHFTASRIAQAPTRNMVCIEAECCIQVNYHNQQAEHYHHGHCEQLTHTCGQDPLLDQIRDFIDCIQTGKAPRACGHTGKNALTIAEQIVAHCQVS